MTYLTNAIVIAVFTLIPTIFIFRKRDEDVLPWGVKSWEDLREQEGGGEAAKYGFPAKKVLLTIPFWLILIIQICFTPHGSLMQNGIGATGYMLEVAGDPQAANFAMLGALMMSVGSWVECVAKILIGVLIDKFGPGIASATFCIIAVIGQLLILFIPTTVALLFIGGALFGTVNSVIVVGIPMLIRQVFGEKTYPVVQGYIAAINTFLAGAWSPLVGALIISFTYRSIYWFGAIATAVPLILFLIVGRFIGKLQFEDDEGNPMPVSATETDPKAA
jgi:MFS family permease